MDFLEFCMRIRMGNHMNNSKKNLIKSCLGSTCKRFSRYIEREKSSTLPHVTARSYERGNLLFMELCSKKSCEKKCSREVSFSSILIKLHKDTKFSARAEGCEWLKGNLQCLQSGRCQARIPLTYAHFLFYRVHQKKGTLDFLL